MCAGNRLALGIFGHLTVVPEGWRSAAFPGEIESTEADHSVPWPGSAGYQDPKLYKSDVFSMGTLAVVQNLMDHGCRGDRRAVHGTSAYV